MSYEEMWRVQLKLYPDSVALSEERMLAWVYEGPDERERLRRLLAVSVSQQRPRYIFYRTAPWGQPGWIGCRYGDADHEYMSGFTP